MKRTIFATVLSMAMAATGFAQMGGGGMGGGMGGGDMGGGNGNGGMHGGNTGGMGGSGGMGGTGGMGPGGMGGGMGGSGMFGVADDASLLFIDGHNGMRWSDEESGPAELANISNDGQERWRVTFEDGQPMMIVSAGDLVVVNVRHAEQDPEFGDWHGGMNGGSSTLVGFDLVSGVQLWTFELEQASMTRAQLSEDGSMVYVMATDVAYEDMGTGSMHQGDGRFNQGMSSTLYALDRFGDLLWTLDLDNN